MAKENISEVYLISVAAELAGMHAQTLRTYDRMGLVSPQRTSGGGRRYSRADVDLLREIQRLSQEEGVNLAGIKSIIHLTRQNKELREENQHLRTQLEHASQSTRTHGELVHVPRSSAVVMWQPRRGRTRRNEEAM